MPIKSYSLPYPRRRLARGLARVLGRLFLPLLFRIRIHDRENFPAGGPLIVVGNHTAVMEAVMMAVYTPWQIEMLGAGDIPQETVTELVEAFFGYIPVNRGHFDRAALNKALDVLRQDGILGVFPEGGIWQAGSMRAQTGVAWLSLHGGAPVLPVYFEDTRGALGAALRLKKPALSMTVGEPIPAAQDQPGLPRKATFEAYARKVLEAIQDLSDDDPHESREAIQDERFELQVSAHDGDGQPVDLPAEVALHHPHALAKLLHRPAILKIFGSNLDLPVQPLQNLGIKPPAHGIAEAARAVLAYLENENPYLLTYRFGPREARAMQMGLHELHELARWAHQNRLTLQITPIRKYCSAEGGEVVQTWQGKFEAWM